MTEDVDSSLEQIETPSRQLDLLAITVCNDMHFTIWSII
jgi:hypothetical protein